MAIQQSICNSFRFELASAIHDLATDALKIALYTSLATLNGDTTAYSDLNEVIAVGYTAGGMNLTLASMSIIGQKTVIDFEDLNWTGSIITARGALIYNATKGGRAIAVLNFGGDKFSVNGDFKVTFPPPDESNAILRIA